MSIINKPPEMVKHEYELQEPIAVAVEKYAAFIASTPDHVVNFAQNGALERCRLPALAQQRQTPSDKKDGHAAAKAARATFLLPLPYSRLLPTCEPTAIS
jgi:hypothetical protein